jgi:hypothetical protein
VNVLIDTNIVIDVAQEREPFLLKSEQVMILAAGAI